MVEKDDRKTDTKRAVIILIVSFLFCFLIRFPFLLLSTKGVNSDQAMVGLMGVHILRGDFPIFWWGQGYMAPVDSYLNSIISYIFGIHNINMQIIPFSFSLFFPFTVYLLAKEVFDREIAIFAFIFTSLPAWFFAIVWGATAGYMIPLSIGSLLLLLAVRMQREGKSKEEDYRRHIILGFLSGLGWWISWSTLPYLAAVGLFLFFRDRFFPIRKSFLLFCIAFLIASLPFWIFNLTHEFWTFYLFHGAGDRNPYLAAKTLVMDNIPLFLGLKYTEYPWSHFTAILGIAYIILFIFLLIGIFKRDDKRGVLALISFTAIVCIAFIFSRWGGLGSPRYLSQLYSVIPVAIAFSLSALRERSRILFYIIATVIIAANLYAMVEAYIGAAKPSERDPDTKGLISFLKSKNIRHTYSDYTLAPRLTFESKEEVICAEPTTERYKRYKEILESSNNFAYVLRKKGSPLDLTFFENNLKAIGIGFSMDDIDSFRVFHSFSQPSPRVEIQRDNWRAVSFRGDEGVFNAFDGDIETAWFSGGPKRDGMWFRVDLGGVKRIAGLSILPGLVPEGNMNGYSIEVSKDGRSWTLVGRMERDLLPALYWYNGGPRFDHPIIKVAFAPVDARYIRITHHGKDPYYNWTIAELFIYKPVEEGRHPYDEIINEGRRLEARGEYRGAMMRYLDAVKSYPDSEEGYYRLMALMQDLHIPLGPDFRKAEAFEGAGLIEKAIENYEAEYRRLYPSGSYSSVLLNRLAVLYEKAGDRDRSVYFGKKLDEEFSPSVKKDIDFGGHVEFLGYDIKEGRSPEIVYYWKAGGNIESDLKAFVHFISPDGKIAFQNDHLLFSDDRPSSKWVRGEVYKERLRVEVSETLRSGTYEIRIGLFDPGTEKRLKVKTGLFKKKDEITIGGLKIN